MPENASATRLYTASDINRSRRSPWHGHLTPGRKGRGDGTPGVIATPITASILLTLSVNAEDKAGLSAALHDAVGVGLPDDRRWLGLGHGRIAWDGPDRYRLLVPSHQIDLAQSALSAAEPLAAIVDQSHGHAVLQMSGPNVDDVLVKGTSMELGREFTAGRTAVTSLGHMAVHLTRLDADEPAVEVTLFRSMAGSFARWLTDSAAMYGLTVLEPRALGTEI